MNRKYRLVSASVLICLGLVAVPIVSAEQDSPPAAASQEKKITKAKHVYTDDDVPAIRERAGVSNVVSGPVEEKMPETKAADKPATALELQKEMDLVKHDKDLLQRRLTELQDKADQATDPFRKKMYEDSISNQQVTLSDFDKQLKDLEAKLAEQDKKEKEKKK
jgi:hypothetical protein